MQTEMEMVEVETSTLIYKALDWAVAKCEGDDVAELSDCGSYMVVPGAIYWTEEGEGFPVEYTPSTDRSQGGLIIERECISLEYAAQPEKWCACIRADQEVYGPTTLIAAMRCYVESKLGPKIMVPAVLLKN